jgi:2-iminobutanoate/2-iminopropanoate deaminase
MIKKIHTDAAPPAIGPYSQAVVSGGFLVTSGQISLNADGLPVGGNDPVLQSKQVFANLDAVLSAAGCARTDVLRAMVYLADMNDFTAVNEVYAEYFGEHRPARACVEVARLPKDMKVEIDFFAACTD